MVAARVLLFAVVATAAAVEEKKAHVSLRPKGWKANHAKPLLLNKEPELPATAPASKISTHPTVSMLTPPWRAPLPPPPPLTVEQPPLPPPLTIEQPPLPPPVLVAHTSESVATAPETRAVAQAEGQTQSGGTKVEQLARQLTEVKQRRTNVEMLQTTLASEVALLRESIQLRKVSGSSRGRQAAVQQVKQSEQIVKDTSAMLREGRAHAAENAKIVLQQAAQIRAALDALETEAKSQVDAFTSSKSIPPPAPPAAPPAVVAEPVVAARQTIKKAATRAEVDGVDGVDEDLVDVDEDLDTK